MAPSIARWSQEMVSFMRRPTASAPSTTTGFSRTEPTARMAPSGRIDDGRELLDVEHAQVGDREGGPGHLGRAELARPRPLGEVPRLQGDLHQRLDVAVAQHRGDEAAVQRHREPDMRAMILANGRALEGGVDARVLEKRERAGADHEIIHGDLGIAFQRVELRAQLPGPVHADLGGDVEVRHRRLRGRHALGDGGAHGRERHVLVLGLGPRRNDEGRPRRRGGGGWRGRGRGPGHRGGSGGQRRLDIGTDDAAAGTTALQAGEIHAGLGRDLLGERRGLDATARGRRARGRSGGDEARARRRRRGGLLRARRAGLGSERHHLVRRGRGLVGLGGGHRPRHGRGRDIRGPGGASGRRRRDGALAAAPATTVPMSSAGSAMTAISSPTGTWSPSPTTTLRSTPDPKASSSTLALSVSTSAMTSPPLMTSPSFFSHLTTLPDSMASDSFGITTLVIIDCRSAGSRPRSWPGTGS